MYKLYSDDIFKWSQEYNGSLFHACLCDPPYHLTSIVKRFGKADINDDTYTSDKVRRGADGYSRLIRGGFMGQVWDGGDVAFRPETWKAIGDCLLPGAYLLAFGGTRTWHRLAVAIEDAGFEIRDTVMYIYGSGFPKSHNVSKAIDREAGAKRTEIIGERHRNVKPYDDDNGWNSNNTTGDFEYTAPATEMAKTWDGYGSALKPAYEPIIVARKPLEGTIAQNCVQYGSGGLNIDECRVEGDAGNGVWGSSNKTCQNGRIFNQSPEGEEYRSEKHPLGRWPANLITDGSDEVLEGFPQTGKSQGGRSGHDAAYQGGYKQEYYGDEHPGFGDSGSAARFFYTAKASKRERDLGCEEMEESEQDHNRFDKCAKCGGTIFQNPDRPSACKCEEPERIHAKSRNFHPTVKPLALTEYLARLILPPVEYAPRRLLVPFSGSGSEMIGAHKAGWEEITGIELSEEYTNIAEARLKYWTNIPVQSRLDV
jgi:site-specific DNA-methyltransferase (adenine-specific)